MKLKVNAPFDPEFMPMAVVYREFKAAVRARVGLPIKQKVSKCKIAFAHFFDIPEENC